jgi:serine/threonine protein kinase
MTAGLPRLDARLFTKGVVIGRGSNGTVFNGVERAARQYVVFKQINGPRSRITEILERIAKTNVICHPVIHRIFGYIESGPESVELVSKYEPNLSLQVFVEKALKGLAAPGWDTRIMSISYGLAYGMNLLHLHLPEILHKDLRSGNVLLNERFEPCITDINWIDGGNSTGGRLRFVAPEILSGDATHSRASDVYSYGVVLFHMITGRLPFMDVHDDDEFRRRIISGQRSAIPSWISPPWGQLIMSCWAQDPRSRPDFSAILTRLDAPELKLPHLDYQQFGEYRLMLISTPPITAPVSAMIPGQSPPLNPSKDEKAAMNVRYRNNKSSENHVADGQEVVDDMEYFDEEDSSDGD